MELALKAVAVDNRLALAHAALCWAYLWQGEHDKAIAAGQLAVKLDSGDVVALERLALSMIWAGNAEPALPVIDEARRLNPSHSYEFPRGGAMFMMSNYGDAIELLQSDFKLDQNFLPSGLYLAACHSLLGNETEAKATIEKVLQIRPGYQLGIEILTQFKNPEDRERFVNGLRQAGLGG